jgi:hypothetical protein
MRMWAAFSQPKRSTPCNVTFLKPARRLNSKAQWTESHKSLVAVSFDSSKFTTQSIACENLAHAVRINQQDK